MLKAAAKLLLLRVLPGRLIPIVTIAEAVLLIRSVRRRSAQTVQDNDPRASWTAPPVDATAPPRDATAPPRDSSAPLIRRA